VFIEFQVFFENKVQPLNVARAGACVFQVRERKNDVKDAKFGSSSRSNTEQSTNISNSKLSLPFKELRVQSQPQFQPNDTTNIVL
jgi:hypothetical protein